MREMTGMATVFGGSGFIGAYVVKRLAARGYTVRVAVRNAEAAMFLRPMGRVGQIVPLYAPVTEEALVARAVQGTDVVINLVGILAERRKGDFFRIHADGAARIARVAASSGVKRLIQVSALGIEGNDSLYARSKRDGEAAVRAAYAPATFLRPSIAFGPEDDFFNRFAAMARLSPILPICGGETKFQPVFAGDIADAVMAALSHLETQGGLYELGGPDVRTFRELIAFMLGLIGRHPRIVNLSPGLARFQASFLERLPGKLLTRDQVTMLQHDNIVTQQDGLTALGLTATPMDLVLPLYLRRYAKREGRDAAAPI